MLPVLHALEHAKVVQPFMLPVLHALEHLIFCGLVALEFICHDHSWYKALLLEELVKESLGCLSISMTLHQDVKHVAFRVKLTIPCPSINESFIDGNCWVRRGIRGIVNLMEKIQN